MRTHLSHIRIAVMSIAAAVFLSGCYHMIRTFAKLAGKQG